MTNAATPGAYRYRRYTYCNQSVQFLLQASNPLIAISGTGLQRQTGNFFHDLFSTVVKGHICRRRLFFGIFGRRCYHWSGIHLACDCADQMRKALPGLGTHCSASRQLNLIAGTPALSVPGCSKTDTVLAQWNLRPAVLSRRAFTLSVCIGCVRAMR